MLTQENPYTTRPVIPDGDRGFSGVNLRLDPGLLAQGLLSDGRNVRLRPGFPETRKGVLKPAWLNRVGTSPNVAVSAFGTIYGAGVFKDPASTEWIVVAADGQAQRTREHNAANSIPLPTGVALLGPCAFVQAFNALYVFRGRYLQPLVLTDFDLGFTDIVPRWSAASAYAAVNGAVAAKEVAYGTFQAVSTLKSAGPLVTATYAIPHGYVTGADVTFSGANQNEYNGRVNVTVLDDSTVTFRFAGSATPTATGTIKSSNMARYWKALGSVVTVSGITRVGTTATATSNGHGFANTQTVTMAGATGADAPLYNGTFVIQNVTANTFDYVMTGTPTGAATGSAITARNLLVIAGRSPDTNPLDWQELFTILPNADTALYVQNCLAVPTAYNPDTGAYDAKADYVVATNYLDAVHFVFPNQFRINQGGSDQLVDLAKFGETSVLCFKEQSFGLLSNFNVGFANISLDMLSLDYGLAARRAFATVGKNTYFLARNRGVVNLLQTELSKLQGVELPLSDPIQPLIDRINWSYAAGFRMAYWDNKLYLAVALDAARTTGANRIPAGAMVTTSGRVPVPYIVNLIPGKSYQWTTGASGFTLTDGATTYRNDTPFTAASTQAAILGPFNTPITATLQPLYLGNNTILVYDFLTREWSGNDTGSAIIVQEFLLATYNGRQRLFFYGQDGFGNLMEEAEGGDQVWGPGATGLGWEQIVTYIKTRGYTLNSDKDKRPRRGAVVIGTWNPLYTLNILYAGVGRSTNLLNAETKDRTAYYQPWDAAPWDATNLNDDHATPLRQDYSVNLPQTGGTLKLGKNGIAFDLFQETREAFKLVGNGNRFAQFELTNAQGRIQLKAVEFDAQLTDRRKGVTT